MQASFVFPAPPLPSAPIVGRPERFAVHRIYCVGRNYADHAREMGASGREPPFFFMKPADAVLCAEPGADLGAELALPYPPHTGELHHEIELVVAIGQGGSNIPVESALSHVWGYAVGLDMTRRDLQTAMKREGKPWDIAKGFDASAPLGPITPAAQVPGIAQAAVSLSVNGEPRQAGNTAQMIWNVAEVIAEISRGWALAPGDLIFTGTPKGVGPVVVGDVIVAAIDGLGPLRARVVAG